MGLASIHIYVTKFHRRKKGFLKNNFAGCLPIRIKGKGSVIKKTNRLNYHLRNKEKVN